MYGTMQYSHGSEEEEGSADLRSWALPPDEARISSGCNYPDLECKQFQRIMAWEPKSSLAYSIK